MISSASSSGTSTSENPSAISIAPIVAGLDARLAGDRADEVARPDAGRRPAPMNSRTTSPASPLARGRAAPRAGSAAGRRAAWRPRRRRACRRRRTTGISRSSLVAGRRRVRQLHGGRGDVDDVELLRQRFDDDADVIEVAGEQPLAQRRAGQLEPPGAEVRHRRHRGDFDLLLGEVLDRAQQPVLARLGERDRRAARVRRVPCGRCGARRPPATAGTS